MRKTMLIKDNEKRDYVIKQKKKKLHVSIKE